MSVALAGIDLAWQSDKNASGIAIGLLSNGVLELVDARTVGSQLEVQETLNSYPDLSGIAIDAPLVIPNQTGQRSCERQVGSVYGSRKASCHTSNLSLYPDAGSVKLSRYLEGRGYEHLGSERWQIETYPHPAIIEMFGLPERLLYKKGKVGVRRRGQGELGRLIGLLSTSPVVPFRIPERFKQHLSQTYIESLKGKALKENEDLLDALICLYVAGLYSLNRHKRVFGSVDEGYVYVPNRLCI